MTNPRKPTTVKSRAKRNAKPAAKGSNPTTTVRDHLLAQAAQFEARDLNPVTAWDCIGAAAWAKACRRFAREIRGMTDKEALAHLKARRREAVRKATPKKRKRSDLPSRERIPGWYLAMDIDRRMDELLDPVARTKTGWIEIDTFRDLPCYRRMLGLNQCVASCSRKPDETDEAWLERRAQWLSRYHPKIKVLRMNAWNERRERYDQEVATVDGFIAMRHLDEKPEYRGILTRPAASSGPGLSPAR
jgi:hypothetical protein